ncbi:hypothetical protein DTO271G3_8122 [Paecilomyces variotii]|nr:hypothetical protein DTO271G3_8122 [Paecilomyces variotii]
MNLTSTSDRVSVVSYLDSTVHEDELSSQTPVYTLIFSILKIRFTLLFLILGAIAVLHSRKRVNPLHYKHIDGRKMKILDKDTRYLRFTHGKELSQEGEQMSGPDPYLVKNKSKIELVLFSPNQVRDFFEKDARYHEKKQDANMGQYFLRSLGQCVGVQNGERWHKTRRHLEAHFSAGEAASMILEFQKALTDWATKLPGDSAATPTSPGTFLADSVAACRKLPFRMISMSLYGDMLTDEVFERLWHLNKIHEKVTAHTFFGTWENMRFYRYLPTAANRALHAYEDGWREFNLDVIGEARKSATPCRAERMFQAVERGEMTTDMFLQSLDEILFTNIDVTSAQFAYALINIGRTPNSQQRLYEEVKAIESDETKIAEFVRREDTFLHKTYLEILRNNPPVWFSLPETTAVEKRIDGFLIPAGTTVIIDTQRLNKTSPIWGEDGNSFRPERWDKVTSREARYSMLGYGMGPRKCLGKNVANVIIKQFLVAVMQHFELNTGDGATHIKRDRFTCMPEQVVEFRQRKIVQE